VRTTPNWFAWFTVNYRLAPQHHYPACVEDVESAIRWVKANAAEYKPWKMKAAGNECDLIVVEGGAHGMGGWEKVDATYKSNTTRSATPTRGS